MGNEVIYNKDDLYEFIWDYDTDTNELYLLKRPESYTEFLSGFGEEMWKKVDGTYY